MRFDEHQTLIEGTIYTVSVIEIGKLPISPLASSVNCFDRHSSASPMFYAIKTIFSALIIVLVGEASKRSQGLAALLLALPIVSVISFVWLYVETGDKVKVADLSHETFWYVLPTLPMFLALSWLLRHGLNLYLALAICAALTAVLFALTQALMVRLG